MPTATFFPTSIRTTDPCPHANNSPIHSGYTASVFDIGGPNYLGPLSGGLPVPAATYPQFSITPPCPTAIITDARVYMKTVTSNDNPTEDAFKLGSGACQSDGAEGSNTGDLYGYVPLTSGVPLIGGISAPTWANLASAIGTFYSLQGTRSTGGAVAQVEVEYLYIEVDYFCGAPSFSHTTTTTQVSKKPGETNTHTIVVTNTGSVSGSTTVSWPAPSANSSWTWTATVSGTGSGQSSQAAAQATAQSQVVTLGAGSKVTYVVSELISSTATVGSTRTFSSTNTPSAGGGSPTTVNGNLVTIVQPMAVSKSMTTSAIPGGSFTSTVTFTNTSAGQVNGMVLADPLATGVTGGVTHTWSAANAGAVVGGAASGSGAFSESLTSMAGGATRTYTIAITTTGSAIADENCVNAATATYGGGTVSANASGKIGTAVASVVSSSGPVVTVVGTPDLSTSAKTGPATAETGEALTYYVTVSNTGTGPANSVSVADACPQLIGISVTPATATINAGASQVFTVAATVAAGASGNITNTATITASNHATLTRTAITSVLAADLSVSAKSVTQTTVGVGKTTTFNIQLKNAGPGVARNVTLVDNVPAGLSVTSWSAPGATPASGSGPSIAISVPYMASGEVVHVSATATGATAGSYTNTATIAASGVASFAKSAPAVTVVAPNLSTAAKTSNLSSVYSGFPVTFTVTTPNTSASADASNVAVTDVLPAAGFDVVSWSAPGATPSTGGANSTVNPVWSVIPAGTSKVLTISAIAKGAGGTYTNTANISATGIAPFSRSAPAVTVLPAPPDFTTSTKTGPAGAAEGNQITYTIVAKNTGQGPGTNVYVTDTNANLTITSITPAMIASILPGAQATFTVVATVNLGYSGNLVNIATINCTTNAGLPYTAAISSNAADAQQIAFELTKTTASGLARSPGTAKWKLKLRNACTITVSGLLDDPVLPPAQSNGRVWSVDAAATSGTVSTALNGLGAIVAAHWSVAPGEYVSWDIEDLLVAGLTTPLTISNTATISLDPGFVDPSPQIPVTASTLVVGPPAHFTLTKQCGVSSSVPPGGTISWSAELTNAGTTVANGVLLDELPSWAASQSWKILGGTVVGPTQGTGTASIPVSLGPTDTAILTVTTIVANNAVNGPVENVAKWTLDPVFYDSQPPAAARAFATVKVPDVDVVYSKIALSPNVRPGYKGRFQLTFVNNSIVPVAGTLSDPVGASALSRLWEIGPGTTGSFSQGSSGSGALSGTVNIPPKGIVQLFIEDTLSPAVTPLQVDLTNTSTFNLLPGVNSLNTLGQRIASIPIVYPGVITTQLLVNRATTAQCSELVFTATVTNTGIAENGGAVTVNFPTQTLAWQWSRSLPDGATGSGPSSGYVTGAITDTVKIPGGKSVVYTAMSQTKCDAVLSVDSSISFVPTAGTAPTNKTASSVVYALPPEEDVDILLPGVAYNASTSYTSTCQTVADIYIDGYLELTAPQENTVLEMSHPVSITVNGSAIAVDEVVPALLRQGPRRLGATVSKRYQVPVETGDIVVVSVKTRLKGHVVKDPANVAKVGQITVRIL